jgi:glutathione S-transferase
MTTTLYGFGESGHSYKVALMMTLTKTPYTLRFVDFFKGEARSPEFLAINEMGECPVLEVDGRIMTQSGVIMSYLVRKTGQFGGATDEENDEILRWVLWDNHKLSAQVGVLRFLMNFLTPEKRPEGAIAFLQGRLKVALTMLDKHLSKQDWVALDRPTIADFSCCSYLYYPEPFGFDRTTFPHIAAWLDRIAALPGWKHPYDLMPRAFPGA